MFAGIDCLGACLWIEHPAIHINIPSSLIRLSPFLPCFLKLCIKSFLSDFELREMETDVFMSVRELCQILSSSKREAPITTEQGRPNFLSLFNTPVASILCCEPTRWISWGHRAEETSCACVAAEYFTLWGCVWKQPLEKILFSAAAECYGPSPDWTCAHRTIPERLGCLPVQDARSMSLLPLPFHDEVCGVSFTITQRSCILHSLGAVRPDPDEGLQMLL